MAANISPTSGMDYENLCGFSATKNPTISTIVGLCGAMLVGDERLELPTFAV